MARSVDHHKQRRLEVLAAARRVIVRDGIEAATTRNIAPREAGCSSGALTHYFADKDDILLLAAAPLPRAGRSRDAAAGADRGRARPRRAARAAARQPPARRRRRTRETRLEIDFSSRGLTAEHLADVQRREHAKLRAAIRRHLAEAHEAGEITLPRTPPSEVLEEIAAKGRPRAANRQAVPEREPADDETGDAAGGRAGRHVSPRPEDLDAVAQRLLALVDGLSVHLLLYPDRLSRDDAERLGAGRSSPPSPADTRRRRALGEDRRRRHRDRDRFAVAQRLIRTRLPTEPRYSA